MTAIRLAPPRSVLPDRLASLDGLRGVASVIVLVHHALLTVPFLARAYYSDVAPVPHASVAWWLTYTPLHLVWAGTEAVYLFFVLSGVVLVLPVLRSRAFDWMAFFPRRIIRIAGPVAVALVLGSVLALFVPRFDDHALGHWMNLRPNTVSASDLLSDLMLVSGTSGFVSPLWSLQWEMIFSAFLPVFVILAVAVRRRPSLVGLVVASALVVGSVLDSAPLFYLSLFAIGALIVGGWDRVSSVARRIARRRFASPALVLLALVAASSTWWSQGLGLSLERATELRYVAVVGVVLLLLAAAFWAPLVRVLEGRVLQWLGRISFALYLVHEPIVTTTRFLLFHVHAPTWVSIAVSVPLAVGAAVLFARWIEAPFHVLARAVGRRAALLTSSPAQPRPAHGEGVAVGRAPVLDLRPPRRQTSA